MFDHRLHTGVPLLVINLDVSKAFDSVNWQALWAALTEHGVPQHLSLILQLLYQERKGEMVTNASTSREFDIQRGVRQGCVLSSIFFGWRQTFSEVFAFAHDTLASIFFRSLTPDEREM